ncbi:hypothetical protein E3P84_00894 [Wallemia ichthyophaga]|nr:hypothetical protein E3P84_00894 [Wallemia ichthyophaga]TIB44102.1 hypothetical protein E3P83_00362 [Wallemia ichthyophaga]
MPGVDKSKDPTSSEESVQKITKAFNDGLLNNKSLRKEFALDNNFHISKVERWTSEKKRLVASKPAESQTVKEKAELMSDNLDLEDRKPFFGTDGSTIPFQLLHQPYISSGFCNSGLGTSAACAFDANSNSFPFQPVASAANLASTRDIASRANLANTVNTANTQAIANPTPLHVYLNLQATISSKAFAASVWNLANSGRLVVMPESSAYNHERQRGPVTETLAPSNTESFSAFIEQYYESLSDTNRQVVNSTIANDEAAPAANVNSNANANGPIDLASPFEPNLFKPNSNSFTTPFKK